MTVRGNEVIFHSALSFIRMFVSVRSILTASVICRIVPSLRYDPVTKGLDTKTFAPSVLSEINLELHIDII